MASKTLLRNISCVDDVRVALDNSTLRRALSIGTSWNKLRIGLRLSVADPGAVRSADGALICVCVYKRGALEVAKRLEAGFPDCLRDASTLRETPPPAIAGELKSAFKLSDTQAAKITRRVLGRARFFQRALSLVTGK